METMTVQVLLGELETARESLDRAFACLVVPKFTEVPKTDELISREPAARHPTIKFVTENGFSLQRVCEREGASIDSANACHFFVRGPNDEERRVTVAFSKAAIDLVQGSNPLSLLSPFWLYVAERYLATFLWEKDEYPPDGRLTIDQLSEVDSSFKCNLNLRLRSVGATCL